MKKITYKMLLIILLTPLIAVLFVKYITPMINDSLPYNLRNDDSPLYSYMTLNKNYKGYLLTCNLFSGIKKYTHSTNSYGLRSPQIDFGKELVLISGDSIPFGLGLNDENTFGWLLNKKTGTYHYINAGIPGKDIAHNLLTLKYFLQISKAKNTKIKYFINYINYKDFISDSKIDVIERRWKKEDLKLREKLMVRFPLLSFMYDNLSNPSNSNAKIKTFFFSIFFLENTSEDNSPEGKFSFSKENIKYQKEIGEICQKNNIKLINVITPYSKTDISSDFSNSNIVKKKLIEIDQKKIILIKDVYKNNNFSLDRIRKNNDYVHFSAQAMKLVSDTIKNYIKQEDSRS